LSARRVHLEELGHIEEDLALLILWEVLSLIEQEYDLVEEVHALGDR